ncbi:hypothetical protein E2I00_009953, partial [Balaenoptera physalus]
KDYENAIKFYSQAIELSPSNAIYYGNRSLAYLRTDIAQHSQLAMRFASLACTNARPAKVVKVKPHDKDAKMKYQECNKIVKQKAFERAIAGDEHRRSVVDSLDIESMMAMASDSHPPIHTPAIEDEYSGPKLEDGKVTITFMKELMQWYKDQKKLHRKCAYQVTPLSRAERACDPGIASQPGLNPITGRERRRMASLYHAALRLAFWVAVGENPRARAEAFCGGAPRGSFYDLLNIFELNGLPSDTNPYVSFLGRAGPSPAPPPGRGWRPYYHPEAQRGQAAGPDPHSEERRKPRCPKPCWHSRPQGSAERSRGQIFNGDFVDRGSFSVEVILTLFGFKLLYPDHFHLLRGNHETDNMNQIYGFEGPMCDLLWSDPQPQNGRSVSKRGVSCQFGPDVTKAFLEENNLDYIIRSHEVKAEGYEAHPASDGPHRPLCPCPRSDQMGNKAAYIHLRGSDLRPQFHQFTAVPHPDVKPMAYASTLLQLGMM